MQILDKKSYSEQKMLAAKQLAAFSLLLMKLFYFSSLVYFLCLSSNRKGRKMNLIPSEKAIFN